MSGLIIAIKMALCNDSFNNKFKEGAWQAA